MFRLSYRNAISRALLLLYNRRLLRAGRKLGRVCTVSSLEMLKIFATGKLEKGLSVYFLSIVRLKHDESGACVCQATRNGTPPGSSCVGDQEPAGGPCPFRPPRLTASQILESQSLLIDTFRPPESEVAPLPPDIPDLETKEAPPPPPISDKICHQAFR